MLAYIFTASLVLLAVNSYAQAYDVTFELLTASSDTLSVPTSSTSQIFRYEDSIALDGLRSQKFFIDFSFEFDGEPVDSVEVIFGLGALAFTPITPGLPNISSLGMNLDFGSSSGSEVGGYRTDTSIVFFWNSVTYRFSCENTASNRHFSISHEITKNQSIYTTIYDPLMDGCDDFLPGTGFTLPGGSTPIGPSSFIVANHSDPDSIIFCGVDKFEPSNQSISVGCSSFLPAWYYPISESYKLSYLPRTSSNINHNQHRGRLHWWIEESQLIITSNCKYRSEHLLLDLAGRPLQDIYSGNNNIAHFQSGVYILHTVCQGESFATLIFLP